MSCTHFVKMLPAIATAIFVVYHPRPAIAAQVGSFNKTCYARNWVTGAVEPVLEINVYDQPNFPYMAYTKKLPGGKWRIEWNYPRIVSAQLTESQVIFLFYHECAHARFASPSESVADCEGVRAMSKDNELSSSAFDEIRYLYKTIGREFPPPGC